MRYFYFVLSVNGRIGTGKVARAIVANAKMTINIDPNATQAIDDAFDSKKNEINNASNLTDSEKTDLINQAAEIANAAKDAINNATTNATVTAAENKGIEDIANVNVSSLAETKQVAIDAINKLNDPATTTNEVITDTRDKAIDQITNLFIPTLDSVKKDAQEAINSAKEAKIDEINKATLT